MMTFQHNKKRDTRQAFIINGRLFFANLLTTFKNLFELGKGILKNDNFCTCGIRGQSAMEYFAIIFLVVALGAIGAHGFFNQAKVSGNVIYEKALQRMTSTALKASSSYDHMCMLNVCGPNTCTFGVDFDDETGVPQSTYQSWFSDADGIVPISCQDYAQWFPGLSWTGANQTRTWFGITSPTGTTRTICLLINSGCQPSPAPGPFSNPEDAQSQIN